MRRLLALTLALTLLIATGMAATAMAATAIAATTRAGAGGDWQQKVDAGLLAQAGSDDSVEFLVRFRQRANLSAAAGLPTKEAKGRFVYEELRRVATSSQAGVRDLLDTQGVQYRPYWVANMIWVRGDSALVQRLAARPEVASIHANPSVQLDAPADFFQRRSLLAAGETLWNLELASAPAVWAQGYEGQGVVVGGQDTGYTWTHPALQPHYRGWDGATADHNYNWHDAIHEDNPNTSPGNSCGYDTAAPCDDGYHGTHTMGTMVGGDGAGQRTGMAPQAKWIGCRNMEDGWGTPATYTECFEWFIAPYPIGGDSFSDGDPVMAPHVINNSWSCPPSEGCSPDILRDVVEAVRAAGIVTVQSAGNAGPQCGTVNTPAAIYDASFTTGAVSNTGDIAGFSGRGPTADGIAKPDIVAPGVGIYSTIFDGGYAELSGTSMASPHVAGLVALLISAEPSLAGDVDAIEAIITQAAVPKTTSQGCGGDTADSVPNHVFGWGLIDAAAAIESVKGLEYTIYVPFGSAAPVP